MPHFAVGRGTENGTHPFASHDRDCRERSRRARDLRAAEMQDTMQK
jgi:hypothetical protein